MAVTYEYSEQGFGGIGYRLDIKIDAGTPNGRQVAYTTNQDGGGLFFHNGRGGRDQIAGNGQFSARSLRSFRASTASILKEWQSR